MKRLSRAAVAAALAVALPAVPASAHHRDDDKWERRYDHHHGRWIYGKDRRVTQHRRWHDWRDARGSATATRHGPGPRLRVDSTAYCLQGYMANGQRAHTGAAAMNGVALGTRFRIQSGPLEGEVFTVKDRIGSGSDFDVAMPGRCGAARNYGRRTINIKRL